MARVPGAVHRGVHEARTVDAPKAERSGPVPGAERRGVHRARPGDAPTRDSDVDENVAEAERQGKARRGVWTDWAVDENEKVAEHAETEVGYCVAMGAGRGIRRAGAHPVCQPPGATRDGVAEVAE